MTVEAMRAAVTALRAGAFDGADVVGSGGASAAVVGRPDRSDVTRLPWADAAASSPVVLVLAGHAGAGASTVAVAVAEGLAEDRRRVHVVEYADPAWSGLVAASSIELGADGSWRRGRRGRLEVFRLARCHADGQLPPPPDADAAERWLVVDAGLPLTTALLDPRSDGTFLGVERVVVVTRAAVPALRQTEQVLAAVGGRAVVAAVGPARWPRALQVTCGRRLAELRSRGRVVRVPADRRLEATGLTGDRLPKPVAAAGRSLAALLLPAPAAQPRHRPPAESSRTDPAGEAR